MAVAVFVGFSAVVCSGVSKRSLIQPACINSEKCCSSNTDVENMQPTQLVSVRIMQLI